MRLKVKLVSREEVIIEVRQLCLQSGIGSNQYTSGQVNRGMIQSLQFEREALYVDNTAIHALWRDEVSEHDLYGRDVGHIVMTWEESLRARSAVEIELVAELIRKRQAGTPHPAATD